MWRKAARYGHPDFRADLARGASIRSIGKRKTGYSPACCIHVASEIMCRKCAGLKYERQYRSTFDRNIRNCQMIRLRLGGPANLLKPFPPRPKGMRLARYLRLWGQASQAESLCWSALSKKVSTLVSRMTTGQGKNAFPKIRIL